MVYELSHIDPNEKTCAGCSACAKLCPSQCITMTANREGFQVAVVDEALCVNCGACKAVCPFISPSNLNNPNMVYAFQLQDETERTESASGGAFFALASRFVQMGGLVCSAIDNAKEGGSFSITGDINTVKRMRGSKYYYIPLKDDVASMLVNAVKTAPVLFCGLPCQVYAARKMVRNSSNFLGVDLLCQGAPSQMVVDAYRREEESRRGARITKHSFRSKRNPDYRGYIAEVEYSDGHVESARGDLNIYNCAFQHKLFLREACYNCPFAGTDRAGDITIGDFWGIKSFNSSSQSNEVSLILANSLKGNELVSSISEIGVLEEHDLAEAIGGNATLSGPVARPRMRSVSFKLLGKVGFRLATSICYPKVLVKQALMK